MMSKSASRTMSTLPEKLAAIGECRWDDEKMKAALDSGVYQRFREANKSGADLDKADKKAIAKALFEWATGLGAVNFAHWFSPVRSGAPVGLGGSYGMKHDTMIDLDFGSSEALKPITVELPYDRVFVGETDGSSFPNGGLRQTHTAAGFTAWDRTSPPIVRGETLYIPTAFVSHYGAALDEKTPLLRSQAAISKWGVKLLKAIGYQSDSEQVFSNVGWEQEFFVIDKEQFLARPDLRHTGRALIGLKPARNQQTDLNYFNLIPPRVKAFLEDCQGELLRCGVALAVYHNEVAPGQHEVSPIFSLTNVATDQNELCLEIMSDVAAAHGLVVLNHEKPFAGINGNGKHLNWGLNSETGKNLFVTGKTPEAQASFMTFVAALAWGLANYGDIVRTGVASAGNDHRLGAQEAPPAIISLYTGLGAEEKIDAIIAGGPLDGYGGEDRTIASGCNSVGPIGTRAEDRNRTAPFPFCGNRFELRACGSSQNIGFPLACVNTIMAAGCKHIVEMIEGGLSVRDAVAKTYEESRNVIFNGNGYSDEWPIEAEKRGLQNLRTTVAAVEQFAADKNKAIFSDMEVFTPEETEARQEIMFEQYVNAITCEATTLVEMMETGLIPAAAQDLARYAGSSLAGKRPEIYEAIAAKTAALEAVLAAVPHDSAHGAARYCLETVVPAMAECREAADAAESKMAADLYPFPTYTDVLLGHHADASPPAEF